MVSQRAPGVPTVRVYMERGLRVNLSRLICTAKRTSWSAKKGKRGPTRERLAADAEAYLGGRSVGL